MGMDNFHRASVIGAVPMGNTYGYVRVSTVSQREDRQLAAMDKFGIPREYVFMDKQSDRDFDRPAYNNLMARLSSGDTLVVNIKIQI